jgi:hypothetical protein
MTADPVAWLRAVLKGIEQAIRAERHDSGSGPLCTVDLVPGETEATCSCGLGGRRAEVLASVKADRAILALGDTWKVDDGSAYNLWEDIVRLVASRYRHRPGYLEEWSP